MEIVKVSEVNIIATIPQSTTYSHFFYIDHINTNAICKICLTKFEYHQQKTGTRSLKRHLDNKHPKVASAKEKTKSTSSQQHPTLISCGFIAPRTKKCRVEVSTLKKSVLTLACSRHILPLQFFEDPIISQGFGLPSISRHDVRSELRKMAVEIKSDLMDKHRGEWASIVLDGWKNPVSHHKHLTILLFFSNEPSKPVFLQSFLLPDNSALSISTCVFDVLDNLDSCDIKVISAITDNARCMVAAMELVFQQRPTVLPLRCSAHIINLIIKDALIHVEFIKVGFQILLSHIQNGIIKRYCETRWNSVFDRFMDLAKYLRTQDGPSNSDMLVRIENTIAALSPFIDVLNVAQKDGCDWLTLYKEFSKAVEKTSESGWDNLAAVAENRRHLLLNPVVHLDMFVTEQTQLSEASEGRLHKWLDALGVPEFHQYVCGCEFHSIAMTPRRLRLFVENKLKTIPVSEAAVERCFSVHKFIHSPLRASMSNEVVDDILFIRYNHSFKYDIFSPSITEDSSEFDCLAIDEDDGDK